jgi:hypothetical protein
LRGGLNRWIETGMLTALIEEYIKSMNRNWYVNSFNLNVDSINEVDMSC